jgi:hypothetical protein
VLDIDLTGTLWTVALAIQQFRRQEVNDWGFRGKGKCHICYLRDSSKSLVYLVLHEYHEDVQLLLDYVE